MSIQFQAHLQADFGVRLSVGTLLLRTLVTLTEELAGRLVDPCETGDL
jgi:hypothetical protein